MIEAHNKLYDQGIAPFDRTINQFADMTEEEFLSKYTTNLNVKEGRSQAAIQRLQNTSNIVQKRKLADVPSSKNWYKEGKVSRPYDQNGCGGCWAFSTASAVESLLAITGQDENLTELSVQQLIDCDTKDNYACDGGWMYEGFQYVS